MATTRRESPSALIDELFAHPERFDFFQAVRLLEAWAASEERGRAVGGDEPPEREAVRMRARPSLAFAGSEIHSLRRSQEDGPPAILEATFLGFVGTAGVMPQHYTALAIERAQLKDSALRDFLDLFQHRTLSLFYRAWCKYRFPVAFERGLRAQGREDTFTRAAHALVGRGEPSLRRRQAIDDGAIVFEAGHFARSARTPGGLEQVIEDLFGVTARLEPFVGRWLEIPEHERCILPRTHAAGGVAVQLGQGATLGSRVWDVQSKVRLHLGPLDLEHYRHLAPGGRGHHGLVAITRSYLGIELDFEIVLTLTPGDGPPARLARRREDQGTRLGRDAWLVDGATQIPLVASFPT